MVLIPVGIANNTYKHTQDLMILGNRVEWQPYVQTYSWTGTYDR